MGDQSLIGWFGVQQGGTTLQLAKQPAAEPVLLGRAGCKYDRTGHVLAPLDKRRIKRS